MWKMLLTTIALRGAATGLKTQAYRAALGLVSIGLILIATTFASVGIFYLLSQSLSPASAALFVAAGVGVLSSLALLAAHQFGRSNTKQGMLNAMKAPVASLASSQDIQKIENDLNNIVKQIGPMKLSAAAILIGILLTRR